MMLMQIYLGNEELFNTIEGDYTRDQLLNMSKAILSDKDTRSKIREHSQSDKVTIMLQEKCAHCGMYCKTEIITEYI